MFMSILLYNHYFRHHRKVLQYYDGVAGSDLKDEMRSKRDLLSNKIESSLEKFNLSIANEPLEMRARVLRDPIIQFCERRANITNGSFNLMGVSFPRCVSNLPQFNSNASFTHPCSLHITALANWNHLP